MSSYRRSPMMVLVEHPSAEASRVSDTSLGDFNFDDVFTYGDTSQQRRSADSVVKPQLKAPRTMLV